MTNMVGTCVINPAASQIGQNQQRGGIKLSYREVRNEFKLNDP